MAEHVESPPEVAPVKQQKTLNPITLYKEWSSRRKIARRDKLLRREEQMNQDLERFLMQIEEERSWLAYELNSRNYNRLLREEKLEKLNLATKKKELADDSVFETGLQYYAGIIESNTKWQNTAAKILDMKGHSGAVSCCQLSKCMNYVLSCSADKTAKVWNTVTGKCLRTYVGHSRKVTGGDFHPTKFTLDSTAPVIVTCSGDGTLRLWSTTLDRAVKVYVGHSEAVYKCSFSPDGQRIVSCSEDKTIRLWCYPDGYLLHVFDERTCGLSGHHSAITTVRFSPTGKYLVSGSDYGERKLILWNASMPNIESPSQFPHMIFWNKNGLIKKILLRNMIPHMDFWLTSSQLPLIDIHSEAGEKLLVTMWPGEVAVDEVMDSEDSSDEESDEDDYLLDESERKKKKPKKDDAATLEAAAYAELIADDVGAFEDVQLSVICVDTVTGEHHAAKEYIPGNYLVVKLESINTVVVDSFVTVMAKNTRFDVFDKDSGKRVGKFKPDSVLPGEPAAIAAAKKKHTEDEKIRKEELKIKTLEAEQSPSPDQRKTRAPVIHSKQKGPNLHIRELEEGVSTSCNGQGWVYRRPVVEVPAPVELEKDENAADEEGAVAATVTTSTTPSASGKISPAPSTLVTPVMSRKPSVTPVVSPDATSPEGVTEPVVVHEQPAGCSLSTVWLCPGPDVGNICVTANLTVTPTAAPTVSIAKKGKKSKAVARQVLGNRRVKLTFSLKESDIRMNTPGKINTIETAIEEMDRSHGGHGRDAATFHARPRTAEVDEEGAGPDSPQHGEGEEPGEDELNLADVLGSLIPPLAATGEEPYPFDQELRHRMFWQFVREKDWDGVESFFEEKCVMYEEKELIRRRRRVVSAFERIFRNVNGLVLPTPFVHRNGLTRSVAMVEASELLPEEDEVEESVKVMDVDGAGEEDSLEKGEEESGEEDEDELDEGEESSDEESDISSDVSDSDSDAEATPLSPDITLTHTIPLELQDIEEGSDEEHSSGSEGSADGDDDATDSEEGDHSDTVGGSGDEAEEDGYASPTKALPSTTPLKTPASRLTISDLLVVNNPSGVKASVIPFNMSEKDEAGKDDELSSVVTVEMPVIKSKPVHRKKTKKVDIDEVRFTDLVDGLPFHKQIVSLANKEAKDIMKMRKDELVASEEIRKYSVAPRVEREMATLPTAPSWLSTVLKSHHSQAPLVKSKKIEVSDGDKYTNQSRGCELVKYGSVGVPGRFGPPELPMFCSELPEYFPRKAGYAYRVLPYQLAEYEATLVKIAKGRLPDISDLVGGAEAAAFDSTETTNAGDAPAEEGSVNLQDAPWTLSSALSFQSPQERYDQNKLSKSLRKDIGLYLLSERSYLATRRNELTTLPGMQPHYPNTSYHPARAAVAPFEHSDKPQGLMQMFSSTTKVAKPLVEKVSTRSSNHRRARGRSKPSTDVTTKAHSFVQLLPTVGRQHDPSYNIEKAVEIDNSLAEGQEDGNIKPPSSLSYMLAHRRGSFPNAPGLELFAEGVKGPLTHSIQKKKDEKVVEVEMPKASPTSGYIQHFRMNSGAVIVHQGTINDAVFSPSEKRLASAGGGNGAIKIWDPRDGTFVRELPTKEDRQGGKCHTAEVMALAYSRDELYLISAGADSQILVWDMTTNRITRWLRGHADIVTTISISPDCSVIVSSSSDCTLKTWFLTPRKPDPPDPPRVISKTDNSMLLSWTSPPSYNETVTAFFLQYRIGVNREWKPNNVKEVDGAVVVCGLNDESLSQRGSTKSKSGKSTMAMEPAPSISIMSPGISVPPQWRSKVVKDLSAATPYQFRMRAVNRMGLGDWGQPSKLTFTEMGLPQQIERPVVTLLSMTSVAICWFAPNPSCFGSASKNFVISYATDDGTESLDINMRTGVTAGTKTLEMFRQECIRQGLPVDSSELSVHYDVDGDDDHDHTADNTPKTKDSVAAAEGEAVEVEGAGQAGARGEDAESSVTSLGGGSAATARRLKSYYQLTGVELSSEYLAEAVDRSRDETEVFMVAEINNLKPGYMFKFSVQAKNSVGLGLASLESYSVSTLPGLPGTPDAPVKTDATLTDITFQWAAPDDGGSAINGFRIWIDHLNKHVDVHRSCNSYKLDRLLPGKHYFIKVLAKNAVGFGPWSALNDQDNSGTMIAAPEDPSCPMKPIAGTWNSLTLEIPALPYHNGSPIHMIHVEKRVIEIFSKGEWERALHYKVPGDVVLIEPEPVRVPTANGKPQFRAKLPENTTWSKKSKHEPDPYLKSEVMMKPVGSRIKLEVKNLQPKTSYEFRYSVRNSAEPVGVSAFSLPSQRAMTKKAPLPHTCRPPQLVELNVTTCSLIFQVDLSDASNPEGSQEVKQSKPLTGAALKKQATLQALADEEVYPITFVNFDIREMGSGLVTSNHRYAESSPKPGAPPNDSDNKYILSHFIPGLAYKFRIRAENKIGCGPPSSWSVEIKFPLVTKASSVTSASAASGTRSSQSSALSSSVSSVASTPPLG